MQEDDRWVKMPFFGSSLGKDLVKQKELNIVCDHHQNSRLYLDIQKKQTGTAGEKKAQIHLEKLLCCFGSLELNPNESKKSTYPSRGAEERKELCR